MNEQSSSENDQPFRIAVIGGGITGLAAAHRLIELSTQHGRQIDLTLFEAASRVGGVVGTRQVGDYTVETGADSFITNKPWAVSLCERLGMADRLIPTDEQFRRSLVLRNGKPVPVPEGFMLLSPAKIWPVLTSPIFSICGKLRMGLEYFIPRRLNNDDESLADFVKRRFGREALDRLVQPLVGGIYTSDPEKLSLRATLPRFLDMEQDYRSLIRASRRQATRQSASEQSGSGARYGLFATPESGISEIIDALETKVAESANIRLNTKISAINQNEGHGYLVELDDDSTETFDAIIPTMPTYIIADLVQSFNQPLAESLRAIKYASSAIVVSGHKLADIRDPLDAFGLVVPMVEKRNILAVSFTSRKFPNRAPEGCVQLRTFVGGAMQPELFSKTDEEILDIVRGELEEILRVTWNPDFSIVARYDRAMPQYHVGHLERVAQIEQLVSEHANLELAGNAYRGVGLPDSIHSGEQAAERIIQSLMNG